MKEQISIDELQTRMVEIDDEVRSLDDSEFEAKHRLRSEADELRNQLAEMTGDEADALKREWAERAGRKASHTVDTEYLKSTSAIPSPGGGS